MNKLSIFTKILRSPFLFLLVSLFIGLAAGPFQDVSWAQEFPSKEIKMIVPYNPGGGLDIAARIYVDKVQQILGVPIVIVNNAAGSGAAGCLTVKEAKPDGYTLLCGAAGPIIVREILTPDLPYRRTDFIPVCQTVGMPVIVLSLSEAPWKNLKELVDYGKKNPGKLRGTVSYGGGTLAVITVQFASEAGIKVTTVPTKSGTSQTSALLGGHVEFSTDAITPGIHYVREGRLRGLVCTHKVPGFPMIKTFEEEGYPGVSLKLWNGIFAPKGLPKPILTKLTKAFEEALKAPSVQGALEKQYVIPEYRNPEEMSKLIENEYHIYIKIMKETGMIGGS